MILGMSTDTFTAIHVILSLIGIASGLIALFGWIGSRLLPRWTGWFLITTVLTSITGFMFPFHGMTPGILLGILSLIALLVGILALYACRLAGAWRGVFVVAASIALYFNIFVLFAQLFGKVPALKAIAPTMASPVFGITQLVVLAVFVVLAVRAYKGFLRATAD